MPLGLTTIQYQNLLLVIIVFPSPNFYPAPDDYEATNVVVPFSPDSSASRMQCVPIVIVLDQLVEADESFVVAVTTSDVSVILSRSFANVSILDSSGKLIANGKRKGGRVKNNLAASVKSRWLK